MRKCAYIVVFALVLATAMPGADTAADRAFKAAEQAVRAGDRFKALMLYAEAVQLDPANSLYSDRRLALQNTPTLVAEQVNAPDPAAAAVDAKANKEPLTAADLREAIEPPRLKPPEGKKSFSLRGDGRSVLEGAGTSIVLQMVFDAAYQPLPTVNLRAEDLSFGETIRLLERVTDSFFVPLDATSVLVVRDTPQNRTQYLPTMAAMALIPERLSVQEAQEILSAVQQIIEVRRISMDSGKRLVIFRDSVAKAMAARDLFQTLSRSRAQIAVDVEIVSISKTSSLSYGLRLPTSSAIVDFGKSVGGIVNIPGNANGFTNLVGFGGGVLPLGIGIANSGVFGTLTKASGQTLLALQMVSADGQQASFHIGDRYPVVAATFSGLTTDTNVSSTLAPQVNYVDLGVQMKMTPTVHMGGEVTLDVEASFKTLGVQAANGIPSIGSRQYQGKIRLKTGEWAVVAGLVSTSESETPTGPAGLSEIPVLGKLFTKQTKSLDTADVLIVLKPHLTAEPPWDDPTHTIWTGTETRPPTVF
ncbi:MAG: type II and III secretion system protein [Bryobacteraceae bacterium]